MDLDAMERLANAGVTRLSEVKALIAEVRALRERDISLFYELDGVVIDVTHGNGFDGVCLNTIKRVRDALGGAK